jgi:hypothetical protein
MKLKDAYFLIRIYYFSISNNKVRSPLTDMIHIFMMSYEIARWTPELVQIVRRDRVAVEVLKARARVFI